MLYQRVTRKFTGICPPYSTISLDYSLVGGIPTPLKNMSSSMGRIFPYMENKSHVWNSPTRYRSFFLHPSISFSVPGVRSRSPGGALPPYSASPQTTTRPSVRIAAKARWVAWICSTFSNKSWDVWRSENTWGQQEVIGGFSPTTLWNMMEWKSVGIMNFPIYEQIKKRNKPPTREWVMK